MRKEEVKQFLDNYEQLLLVTRDLLNSRQLVLNGELKEGADSVTINKVEALKPDFDSEQMIAEVNMEIPIREKEDGKSIAFGSSYTSMSIPFYAYWDKDKWMYSINEQKLETSQKEEKLIDVPDWLENVAEDMI